MRRLPRGRGGSVSQVSCKTFPERRLPLARARRARQQKPFGRVELLEPLVRLEHLDELSRLLLLAQERQRAPVGLLFGREAHSEAGERRALEWPCWEGRGGCDGRSRRRGRGSDAANRLEEGEEVDGRLVVDELGVELAQLRRGQGGLGTVSSSTRPVAMRRCSFILKYSSRTCTSALSCSSSFLTLPWATVQEAKSGWGQMRAVRRGRWGLEGMNVSLPRFDPRRAGYRQVVPRL